MELVVLGADGAQKELLAVSDEVFSRDYNEALVHQLVVAYLANARQGTRAQKGRSDVAKSTRKPWKQKGTGRARAGMASSPLWRGGGKIFPSSPNENFSQKINKKMFKIAMSCIYSELLREDRLVVVDDLQVPTPKTRDALTFLRGVGFSSGLLLVEGFCENLHLSIRNVVGMSVQNYQVASPTALIKSPKVLVSKAAILGIEGGLR